MKLSQKPSQNKTTVYYDGLCMACSTEIHHYKRLPGAENLEFLDITQPDFRPESHGLDPTLVHKVMHVRDGEGTLHTGVDAFRAIWSQIPRYQFMVKLSDHPWARSCLELGYRGFVRIRPYLPRYKAQDCSTSPYCEVNLKK